MLVESKARVAYALGLSLMDPHGPTVHLKRSALIFIFAADLHNLFAFGVALATNTVLY